MSRKVIKLPHRVLSKFHGPDTNNFLQGLITNDIKKLEAKNGIAAFLLNTKGRIVEDVILWRRGTDDIFLESSRENQKNLIKEISKYRLRKKVEISECDDEVVYLQNHETSDEFPDPRWSNFGSRHFGIHPNLTADANVENYENLRRDVGISEGSQELSDLLPFQANGDLLNMVSLDKGCYIGQELTARTAHTGIIRRRILPFNCEGKIKPGSDIRDEKGNKAGKIISSDDTRALGILQLSSFKNSNLSAENISLQVKKPEWMPDKILENNNARTSLND